jgi:hypothetical protein
MQDKKEKGKREILRRFVLVSVSSGRYFSNSLIFTRRSPVLALVQNRSQNDS